MLLQTGDGIFWKFLARPVGFEAFGATESAMSLRCSDGSAPGFFCAILSEQREISTIMRKRHPSCGSPGLPGRSPMPVNLARRALEPPSGSAPSCGKKHTVVAVRYEAVRSPLHPGAILPGERKRNSPRDVVFFGDFRGSCGFSEVVHLKVPCSSPLRSVFPSRGRWEGSSWYFAAPPGVPSRVRIWWRRSG